MMRPDHVPGPRWTEIDRLFSAALDCPVAERDAFVTAASGSDSELLAALRRLLDAADASEGWLERPAETAIREALRDLAARNDPPPADIGPFVVLREIGRGGMGTVYLAERRGEGFHQRVAIKVLRRGLDTDDIVARFVRERRILASLTHPGIARLIDGGTTDDGRPYLVMEHVEGEPITSYCDRERWTIRQRLELFLEVTDAVREAHAGLVVHRDLKPSNILVASGRIKLLDFGIAKLLEVDEIAVEPTRTGVFLLTPEIASPEQLRGEPITTATDIYQLGVLLYQLLVANRPPPAVAPARGTPAEMVTPARPSTTLTAQAGHETAGLRSTTPAHLRRLLRGDLDTIVLTALHADATRRYASVEQLATDIRAFLAGRGISASPDTLAYRTRIFLRRHAWVAPAGAALALSLSVYIGTLIRHAHQLERERNAAQLAADRAEQVQGFLVDLFRSADPYAPADPERGQRITVIEALDLGTERAQSELRDRPLVRESLFAAISQVYHSLGALDRALPLREEVVAMQQARAPASAGVAESLGRLAKLRADRGDVEGARRTYEERLALATSLEPPEPTEVARAHIDLGVYLARHRVLEGAQAHLQAALALEAVGALEASDLAEVYRALSDVHYYRAEYEASERAARTALTLRIEAHGPDAVLTGLAHMTLAAVLGDVARFDEARQHLETTIDILTRRLGADHAETLGALTNMSVLHTNMGNLGEAEALQRQLLERRRRVHGERHVNVGDAYQNLGTTLARLGRLDEAGEMHSNAAAVYARVLAPDNYRRALPSLSLSNIRLAQGQFASAEEVARQALVVLRGALPGYYVTAVAECRLGRALAGLRRHGEAESLLEASVPILAGTETVPGYSQEYRDECLKAAAAFYERLGRSDDAARVRALIAPRN